MKKITHRLLSILLTLAMAVSMMPAFSVRVFASSEVTLLVSSEAEDDSAERADEAVYKTIAGALAKAGSGDTVRLMSDITENITIPSDKSITLDLNGFVLQGDGTTSVITAIASAQNLLLTITDSDPSAVHYFTYYSDAAWTYLPGHTAAAGDVAFENMETASLESGTSVIAVSGGCITGGTGQYDSGFVNKNLCGGAVYSVGFHITLSAGNIIGNSADRGAGVFMYANLNANFYMYAGAILGNTAKNFGGGVFLHHCRVLNIDGGKISRNTAKEFGGGIYDFETNAFVTGGNITDNTADSGGGIYIQNDDLIISGDATISRNTADDGGGIYYASNSAHFLQIEGGKITDNTATRQGGGINTTSGIFTVTGGNITGNKAGYYGGGIFASSSKTTVTGGAITGNKADYGGGMFFASMGSDEYEFEAIIGGDAQITGNTTSDGAIACNMGVVDNSAFSDYGIVTILPSIDEESLQASAVKMQVGVTLYYLDYDFEYDTAEYISTAGAITADGTIKYKQYFTADNDDYYVKGVEDHLELAVASVKLAKNMNHGTLAVDDQGAAAESTVTVTATPDDGYELDKLTVKDRDGIDITDTVLNGAEITLPAAEKLPVTACAEFKKLPVFTVTMGNETVRAVSGSLLSKPAAPEKTGYAFGGWYTDEACTNAWNFANDRVTETMTLYAKWISNSDEKAVVTGTVTDSETPANPVYNAVAELWLGTEKVAAANTTADGVYRFDHVENGVYDIVIRKDGKVKTTAVNVNNINTFTADPVAMPAGNVNSLIDIREDHSLSSSQKSDVSGTVAGGVDEVADEEAEKHGAGDKITIVLTVEPKAADSSDTTQAAIKTAAGSKTVEFIDFTLTKQVNDGTKNDIGSANTRILTIMLPYAPAGVAAGSITAYRYHGTAEALIKESAPMTVPADGHYYVDRANHLIYIYASQFSTYAIGYSRASGQHTGSGNGSTYSMTVADTANGTITANTESACAGSTVTLTVTPDKGYTLETIAVLDQNGNEVTLTPVSYGEQYSFRMPASAVTVKASFMEDNTMLNYFVDVNAGDYYYDAVLWAAENGITSGIDPVHFAPLHITTRAQMVTFLWKLAGCPASGLTDSQFTDVKADSYYYMAVLWATEKGITVGTSTTTFSPDVNVSRCQAVTFLWKYSGKPEASAENPFTDVGADAYYYAPVLWAKDQGITSGTSETTFSPDEDCTRGQIVTFLYNSALK